MLNLKIVEAVQVGKFVKTRCSLQSVSHICCHHGHFLKLPWEMTAFEFWALILILCYSPILFETKYSAARWESVNTGMRLVSSMPLFS